MSDPRGVLLDRIISEINDLRRRVEAQEAQEQTPRAQKARALDTQFPDALLHLPFDGGVPYETDYSVNLFGHKLQRPTVYSGGIIGRPGKFGKAVQCAEATTNLVTNPSFEVDTAGWHNYNGASGDLTTTRSSEDSIFGGYSAKSTWTALHSSQFYTSSIYTSNAGVSYTASAWVKAPLGDRVRILLRRSSSPYTIFASTTVDATGEWQRIECTDSDGTAGRVVRLQVEPDSGVGPLYVDGVQCEAKAYPTPYCDGSLGPGHAWTGTPHASTSTRTATDLRYGYPAATVDAFTISCWVNLASRHSSNAQGIFDIGNTNQAWLRFQFSFGEYLFYRLVTFNHTVGLPVTLVPGVWYHVVLTFDGAKACLYWDGALIHSSTNVSAPTWADVCVGFSSSGHLNGYIDDLLILDRALTATEVRRLYEAGQAGLGVICPTQWKVDDSGAADAHVVATDENGDLAIAYTQMKAGDWALNPSDSTTIDIDIPLAPFSLLVTVGGYGNASSGNVNGMWLVAGYGNASVNVTINQLVNVIGNGSMTCAWQASGVLRVTITNSHPDRSKSGFWRTVLVR